MRVAAIALSAGAICVLLAKSQQGLGAKHRPTQTSAQNLFKKKFFFQAGLHFD